MWIFTNESFLSVVEHRDKPGILLVRSRIEGDIERAIPGAEVWEDINADYRYRAEVPKQALKDAVANSVDRISYDNFKSSVKEPKRHNAYLGVWQAMADVYGSFVGRSR
jgi:hypothetical protein